ncbi:hypothetical protein RchiOBHm_Chr1g0378451 [Rosa chinensis]|uniref:Uncharacterized protein n=1 Tax=Rosa chinensis TaxID=74649 RepID=A0A2P6SNC9_ROSCH|nr:hypothetical protein RchiOBHm_Chr1g0378451 [Rosa chinensis]
MIRTLAKCVSSHKFWAATRPATLGFLQRAATASRATLQTADRSVRPLPSFRQAPQLRRTLSRAAATMSALLLKYGRPLQNIFVCVCVYIYLNHPYLSRITIVNIYATVIRTNIVEVKSKSSLDEVIQSLN